MASVRHAEMIALPSSIAGAAPISFLREAHLRHRLGRSCACLTNVTQLMLKRSGTYRACART